VFVSINEAPRRSFLGEADSARTIATIRSAIYRLPEMPLQLDEKNLGLPLRCCFAVANSAAETPARATIRAIKNTQIRKGRLRRRFFFIRL